MTSLSASLRTAIRRRDLTITAAAFHLDVGRVTLQRWLAGTQSPSLEKLKAVAEKLDTTISALTKGM